MRRGAADRRWLHPPVSSSPVSCVGCSLFGSPAANHVGLITTRREWSSLLLLQSIQAATAAPQLHPASASAPAFRLASSCSTLGGRINDASPVSALHEAEAPDPWLLIVTGIQVAISHVASAFARLPPTQLPFSPCLLLGLSIFCVFHCCSQFCCCTHCCCCCCCARFMRPALQLPLLLPAPLPTSSGQPSHRNMLQDARLTPKMKPNERNGHTHSYGSHTSGQREGVGWALEQGSDQPVASVHIPQCLNADREHSTSTYCLPLGWTTQQRGYFN